jgi:hypothetical protein
MDPKKSPNAAITPTSVAIDMSHLGKIGLPAQRLLITPREGQGFKRFV